MVVHFDWYGGGYLCKHDTISMIPWLICDVQVVVAMVTRSVFSSSEQFSAVQRVEIIIILFFVTTCSGSPHNVCISLMQ